MHYRALHQAGKLFPIKSNSPSLQLLHPSSADLRKGPVGQGTQVVGRKLDLQPTAAGADEDGGKTGCRGIDHGRQFSLLPQGADAAQHIAGHLFRVLRLGHRGFFGAEGLRQEFEVQLMGNGNNADHKLLAVGLDNQGLEDPRGLDGKLLRGFTAIGGCTGIVLVGMQPIRHLGFFEGGDRGRHGRTSKTKVWIGKRRCTMEFPSFIPAAVRWPGRLGESAPCPWDKG